MRILGGVVLLALVMALVPGCGGPSISQIVFTTSGQVIDAGVVSSVMTIQTEDASGKPCSVKSDALIFLTSTSATGQFDNGTITSVTIPSGSSSASFYYEDTTAGTPTITAAEFPSHGWTDGTQQETINPALTITTTSLPADDVNVAYSQTLSASGGSGSYTWSIVGPLTDGLSLSGNTISGTPTAVGISTITFEVTDSLGGIASQSLSIIINWVGLNGDREVENVYFEGGEVVGADGHCIELVNNPHAVNPSWSNLESFLKSDQTDKIPYNDNTFVCADFAEMLHNNAEKAGIRAAYVNIDFGSTFICTPSDSSTGCPGYCGGLHACNAFQTTDKGLIYIDDTGTEDGQGVDCTVLISIGQQYTKVSIFSDVEWCPLGVVSNFSVVW